MALRKCGNIFSALFVNELFFEKYGSKIRKCWSFSIRCSMFDFYFFLQQEQQLLRTCSTCSYGTQPFWPTQKVSWSNSHVKIPITAPLLSQKGRTRDNRKK